MSKTTVTLRIPNDILKRSMDMKNIVLKKEEMTFFRLHDSSKNSWHVFIYQMGIIKAKEEFEKFKKNLEDEITDSD